MCVQVRKSARHFTEYRSSGAFWKSSQRFRVKFKEGPTRKFSDFLRANDEKCVAVEVKNGLMEYSTKGRKRAYSVVRRSLDE